MPKLGEPNADLEKMKLPTGFQFSGTRISDLGATEYTIATIVVDCSGSTENFRVDMEKCIQEVVRACQYSPRSDNLMLRVVLFSNDVHEHHGFKLLSMCNADDYDGVMDQVAGGMTALFDASISGIEATSAYGKKLIEQDFSVNGLVVVITDGDNNHGTFRTPKRVHEALANAVTKETLESLVSILVGVNITDPRMQTYLKTFETEAGFSQYVELGNADAKTLAKLADFVSRSISSQSQALGSGGASQPLTF